MNMTNEFEQIRQLAKAGMEGREPKGLVLTKIYEYAKAMVRAEGLNDQAARAQQSGESECECCGYPGHDLPKWRKFLQAARAQQSGEGREDPDLQLIRERDYWEEKATELSEDIGKVLGVEVGEHSSDNCPVQNAIDAVFNANPPKAQGVPEGWQLNHGHGIWEVVQPNGRPVAVPDELSEFFEAVFGDRS